MATVTVDMLTLSDRRASVRKVSRSAAFRRISFLRWNSSSIAVSAEASLTACTAPKVSPIEPVTSSVANRIARRLTRICGPTAWVMMITSISGTSRMAVRPPSMEAMMATENTAYRKMPPAST